MNRHRLIFIPILFLTLTCDCVFCQPSKSIPPEIKVRNYVTDKTGTLTSSQTASLESKLAKFDKETSTQIVVYIISSLEGGSLEETSHDIAEKNVIGQKEKNNGVLLFIAKDDRKLRIEVGYGLEGALPDALADQIIRKEITPKFKQGKYYEGIDAGVDAIFKATKGEYTRDTKDKKSGDGFPFCGVPIVVLIIILFIFFPIVITIVSRICGRGRGSGFGSNWFVGGSGWSSGSSSFSGGGFSGGGGSFGGGGASGSW